MPFERNQDTLRGAMWRNDDGSFYISIDIGLATYKFYGNVNKYKKDGDKLPHYKLVPAKSKQQRADEKVARDDDAPF